MKLNIRKFDPTNMKKHRIILLIGKRGTGKSVLMQDLLYHIKEFLDCGIAMSPTMESTQAFRKVMPPPCVYNDLDQNAISRMINYQKGQAQRGHAIRSTLLVMDDCMYDKTLLKGSIIRDLFMNGRHYHITFLTAAQYLMDIGPDLRTQVDYVFCLRENIMTNKTKLWKYFFGVFEKYNEFSQVMDKVTQNHGCLVLDNTVGTSNIEDSVFWYKAKLEQPEYKLFKRKYWELSLAHRVTETNCALNDDDDDPKKTIVQMCDNAGKAVSHS